MRHLIAAVFAGVACCAAEHAELAREVDEGGRIKVLLESSTDEHKLIRRTSFSSERAPTVSEWRDGLPLRFAIERREGTRKVAVEYRIPRRDRSAGGPWKSFARHLDESYFDEKEVIDIDAEGVSRTRYRRDASGAFVKVSQSKEPHRPSH